MSFLNEEAKRSELISQGKRGEREKCDGKTRFEKRVKQRVATSTRQYNKVDMDSFFRKNILTVNIEVHGETDDYLVTVSFGQILDEIRDQVARNDGVFNLKIIIRALVNAFNRDNVYIRCTCLHPDTRIKVLDGTSPTVKELYDRYKSGEKLYLYSVDKNGDFVPGEVEKVWITQQTNDFIKVTLDNGQELLTTPDHLYMLRDGSYTQAQNLSIGQSLMPMYFQTVNGYECFKYNSKKAYQSTYKAVANYFKSAEIEEASVRAESQDSPMNYKVAIHHKDFNKANNTPENLNVMTAWEHWNYHSQIGNSRTLTEQGRKVLSEKIKKLNANPTERMLDCRKRFNEKGRLRNYDADRKEQQAKVMQKAIINYNANLTDEQRQERSKLRSAQNKERWKKGRFDTDAFKKAAKLRGVKFHTPEMEKLSQIGLQRYWDNISDEEKASRTLKGTYTKIQGILYQLINQGLDLTVENYNSIRGTAPRVDKYFNSIDEAVTYFNLNHKVVNVEYVKTDTPIDVYDIKMKGEPNFLTDAGVILHNCPDFRYRHAYYLSVNNIIAGPKETRPSNKTNPKNDKGPGCKHIMAVLANTSWIIKVSSVIHNYVNWFEKNRQKQYADIIYPAIYGKKYDKDVQLSIFDKDDLDSDEQTVGDINTQQATSGRFKQGNEHRFRPKSGRPVKNQVGIDIVDEDEAVDSGDGDEE